MLRFLLLASLVVASRCDDDDIDATELRETLTGLYLRVMNLENEQLTSLQRIEARLNQLEQKSPEPDFYNCDSSPCMNGASCVETGVSDGFLCVCPPSFFGLLCNQTLHDYSFLVSIVGFPKNMTNFETIVWDDVVENPGGYYDVISGIYTAPLTGLFEFILQKRSNQDMGDFQLRVNGVAFMSTPEGDGFQEGMQTAAATLTVPLQQGDEVTVINHLSTGMWGSDFLHGFESWWSGKLLYAARL